MQLKTLVIRMLLFLPAPFFSLPPAMAQPPDPLKALAQYPLGVEGQSIIRPYDVSGHSHHGTVVNNTKKSISAIFRRGWFANQIPCIEKLTTDDAHISIPNIYKNTDFSHNGFSVSFWIWIDQSQPPAMGFPQSAEIVSMPYFNIRLERHSAQSSQVALYYYYSVNGGLNCARVAPDISFSNQGWYYISVAYNLPYRVSTPTVNFFYSYTDTLHYDPNLAALAQTAVNGPGPIENPHVSPDTTGSMLRAPFQGKVWNVQFFDHALSHEEANMERNDAWYASKKDGGYDGGNRYYAVGNALSFYPCEGNREKDFIDVYSGRNGLEYDGVHFVADRFNTPKAALQFDNKGYVSLPPFYEAYKTSPAFDVREGYTISFWTYIDEYLYPPDDASVPYTDEDTICQFFYISKPTGLLGGMASKRDRAVINRYVALNPTQYWNLWLWDPVSFEDARGWYQVILTQKSNAVRVVLFKPDGEMTCRMNYFNSQDFTVEKAVEFGLGWAPHATNIAKSRATHYLDDIRIFNWPFSQEEAAMLHAYETHKP